MTRRAPGIDPHLDLKIGLFFLAAVLGLAGIILRRPLLIFAAMVVIGAGLLLRFLRPRGGGDGRGGASGDDGRGGASGDDGRGGASGDDGRDVPGSGDAVREAGGDGRDVPGSGDAVREAGGDGRDVPGSGDAVREAGGDAAGEG